MSTYQIVVAILGGLFAGGINTLAGSGSVITLSVLTEVLGLPPNVANGSNRLGVAAQSITSSITFYKKGLLKIGSAKNLITFTIIGALIGIYTATQISNEGFRHVFKFLLILLLFVILLKPSKWLHQDLQPANLPLYFSIPLYLALGFYGGFIQMGMGVFFLAVSVLVAKYQMIQANALKLLVTAVYSIPAILYFHFQGMIDWKLGGIVALGQILGGWLTAKFIAGSPKANLIAHRVLVIAVLAAIIKVFVFN